MESSTAATGTGSVGNGAHMSNLPEEVVMRVLQWVGCRDLCAIAGSSHWGHRVANDDHLWRELFKRDRRKLPFLTDLCFAPTPVVLQNNKKTTPKTWREYYRHRFISDLELWEASSHQLQLWDGNYNPSAATHARDVMSMGPLRSHRAAPDSGRSLFRNSSDAEAEESSDRDDSSSTGEYEDENEDEHEVREKDKADEERRRESKSESEALELSRESESEEERYEERRKDVIKTQMMLARRKRRMISRSTPASTATSPRRSGTEGTLSMAMPYQPPSPFIPYYPPVFPQAKRKAVAFIGPRGSGKATLFYLLKFGRMFRGVRYLRKFGGIVSLDISQLHCHLELEVWDITTAGNLDVNQKIVPFYQLHGVIIIVDGSSLCPDQCSVIRGILQRILNTPPACQSSIRKDSTAVVDYAWLFPPPVLVYNNKCDLQPPGSAFDVASMLDLDGVLGTREAGSPLLKSGRWRVQSCSAMDGRGVIPGMQWLHDSMQVNN